MKLQLRPITKDDLPAYCEMTKESSGFYTMPKDVQVAEARLIRSLESFQKKVSHPDKELYLFVVEDLDTGTIVGTSGIEATTGGDEPLYFFKKERIKKSATLKNIVKEVPILNPISYVDGPTEVCALYVRPQYRKSGVGKLLSFSRFLFIKAFQERFTKTIFAQLRGFLNDEQKSPFWEGVGRHFLDMPFSEVLALYEYGRSFISKFLPHHPLYFSLLPKEVQEVAGKVDRETEGALALLQQIGFEITDEIDVLDGGPKLIASRDKISIIQKSKVQKLARIEKRDRGAHSHILTNERIDFRACYGAFDSTLDIETAALLKVEVHDTIRGYPL